MTMSFPGDLSTPLWDLGVTNLHWSPDRIVQAPCALVSSFVKVEANFVLPDRVAVRFNSKNTKALNSYLENCCPSTIMLFF